MATPLRVTSFPRGTMAAAAEGRVVPSDLFPLVFAFLKENHFEGAARAFAKAAGVTKQDPNAASLLDVFNYWLKSPEAKKRKAFPNGPPAKKAKKESSSSSESSSEDEAPPLRKPAPGTKPASAPKAGVKAAAPVKAESSSEDSSDSSDSEPEKKKPAKKGTDLQVKRAPLKAKPQNKSSSSSSDSSSSEDEAPKKQPPKRDAVIKGGKPASKAEKVAKGMPGFTNGTAKGSGSSSSSEDSDTGKCTPVKTAPKKAPLSKPGGAQLPRGKGQVVSKQSSSSSEDSSDSSEDEKPASKLKPGQYSAVPPPSTLEPKKGKGPVVACKKTDSSGLKEQLSKKKTKAVKQPAAKQPNRARSAAVTQKKESSSSDSDSDSSSEEEDKKAQIKRSAKPAPAKGITKPAQTTHVGSSSDSSDSDSSEEDVLEVPVVKLAPKKAKKASGHSGEGEVKRTPASPAASKRKAPAPKSSSSDSESSSSEEEQSKPASHSAGRTPRAPKAAEGKKAADGSSSSSDSSSDDDGNDEEPKKKGDGLAKGAASSGDSSQKVKKKQQQPKASSTPVGKSPSGKPSKATNRTKSHESSLDEGAVNGGLTTKKRKREDDQVLETPELKKSKIKSKTPHSFPKMKRQSSPFRRVREEEVEVDLRVANNSFDAKKGAAGDWGEKANNVLKFTKGKSFRHEKTKKKRGSYCGGTISTQINSIKFESD